MDAETEGLFARISQRLGWDQSSDLRAEESRLKDSIKKSKKKPLLSRTQPVLSLDLDELDSPLVVSCSHRLDLSGTDSEGSLKENKPSSTRQRWPKGSAGLVLKPEAVSRSGGSLESSDEEPCQKGGKRRGKEKNVKKQDRVPVLISDSSDDDFEMFLSQLKTPKSRCPEPKNLIDGLKDFIVDSDEDFVFDLTKKGKGTCSKKGLKNSRSQEVPTAPAPGKKHTSFNDWMSPVFANESEAEESIVAKSIWNWGKAKTSGPKDDGHIRPASTDCQGAPAGARPNQTKTLDTKERPVEPKPPVQRAVSWESRPPASPCSDSSEDEFESLMERIKSRTRPQTPTSTAKKSVEQRPTGGELGHLKPLRDTVNGTGKKAEKNVQPKPKLLPQVDLTSSPLTPTWSPGPIRGISHMGPPDAQKWSSPCRVPNCFLQELASPTSSYVKNFKQKKHELTQRLYAHFNSTIFDLQLPVDLAITWNNKMRKTAGYCVTGQKRGLEVQRYARIELSDKVCDSPDRLRDTLIHEICHAATWLINSVRDGHGRFWRCYAKKATVIHPELPMVTRCHTYEINYKFTYQCSRCKTTIGRHSKSLDTQRFVCALCQGQLVLLQPVRKDGTSSITKLTPFAKFVKENYGSTKKGTGISHAEVMRKLSADFAAKTQITAS